MHEWKYSRYATVFNKGVAYWKWLPSTFYGSNISIISQVNDSLLLSQSYNSVLCYRSSYKTSKIMVIAIMDKTGFSPDQYEKGTLNMVSPGRIYMS